MSLKVLEHKNELKSLQFALGTPEKEGEKKNFSIHLRTFPKVL